MKRRRIEVPADRDPATRDSGVRLARAQAAELARIRERHQRDRDEQWKLHQAELALVLQQHRRELADLWASEGREPGPWVLRTADPARLLLEAGPLAVRGKG